MPGEDGFSVEARLRLRAVSRLLTPKCDPLLTRNSSSHIARRIVFHRRVSPRHPRRVEARKIALTCSAATSKCAMACLSASRDTQVLLIGQSTKNHTNVTRKWGVKWQHFRYRIGVKPRPDETIVRRFISTHVAPDDSRLIPRGRKWKPMKERRRGFRGRCSESRAYKSQAIRARCESPSLTNGNNAGPGKRGCCCRRDRAVRRM